MKSVEVKPAKEWQVIIILSGVDRADEIEEFYERNRMEGAYVSSVTVRPNVKKRTAKAKRKR